MIDTLLANLDRFDPVAARPALDLPDRYASPRPPAGQRRRPGPGGADRDDATGRSPSALPVVVPLHPRGRPTLEANGLVAGDRLRIVEPLGYVDFVSLVRGATVVVTDSGGIQEETTILGVPCLTVRPNTERPVTITHGTNRLVTPEAVPAALDEILAGRVPPRSRWPAAVGWPRRPTHRRHRGVARRRRRRGGAGLTPRRPGPWGD